jgi:hypothetical protein|tara:strand:+ start:2503 stop:2721 length:219 start_codon:yes stop_codon:yes gene_type:complete
MDLENKTVTIVSMATNNLRQTSTVDVTLASEIATGIFRNEGAYKMSFDVAFENINDSRVMTSVVEKLNALPD